MPSIKLVLSSSLDAALRQAAVSRGRSTEDVVNIALSQYLVGRGYDESNSTIRIGRIELDLPRRRVRRNSTQVHLTPTDLVSFTTLWRMPAWH
jgi:DNA-binding response OmpR family regulator